MIGCRVGAPITTRQVPQFTGSGMIDTAKDPQRRRASSFNVSPVPVPAPPPVLARSSPGWLARGPRFLRAWRPRSPCLRPGLLVALPPLSRTQTVEAMRLCSNPSISPAFDHLLNVVSDSPEISNANSPVSWDDSVRRRSQLQRRLQPDETARLCDEYRDGATASELAVRYQIHRTTALAILSRSGVDRRGKGPSDEQTALALELYEMGNSTASIGELLGFSGETIRHRILAAGIRMRNAHEWRHSD
jgi:hypothetical protein